MNNIALALQYMYLTTESTTSEIVTASLPGTCTGTIYFSSIRPLSHTLREIRIKVRSFPFVSVLCENCNNQMAHASGGIHY